MHYQKQFSFIKTSLFLSLKKTDKKLKYNLRKIITLVIKSNARDTTYFTTIYLQTDMALMWQYTISAIKTPN
jgi:uncharacterized membrane protein YobD (UPF0266 family)